MKLLCCAVVVLSLSGSTCHRTIGPPAYIHGTVRYTDGRTVERAKVWTDAGGETFTDAQGRYAIIVSWNARAITVFASDGFTPGMVYGVTHFGIVRVSVSPGGASQDIVLDQSRPI